jgi:hypothetical protein
MTKLFCACILLSIIAAHAAFLGETSTRDYADGVNPSAHQRKENSGKMAVVESWDELKDTIHDAKPGQTLNIQLSPKFVFKVNASAYPNGFEIVIDNKNVVIDGGFQTLVGGGTPGGKFFSITGRANATLKNVIFKAAGGEGFDCSNCLGSGFAYVLDSTLVLESVAFQGGNVWPGGWAAGGAILATNARLSFFEDDDS